MDPYGIRGRLKNLIYYYMTREEFRKNLYVEVETYIENFDGFDSNPQMMVNPVTLLVRLVNGSDMLEAISDSDEAIEEAAAAEDIATEDSTDAQVKQNPDFYGLGKMLHTTADGKIVPDNLAINRIVSVYFPE